MIAFILDTSRKEGFVALAQKNNILHLEEVPSNEFLPRAAALLQETKPKLDFIAVGIGPGSYTGTRAGVAFAKSLAFAKQMPLLGFYSPLAYLPQEAGPFACLIPGKRNDSCIIKGLKTTTALLSHETPRLIPNDELPPSLLIVQHESATLNLSPLFPYLLNRITLNDFDPSGEVDVAYLY